MVKDEGALRFVSMDEEEEEKRLKIIQAILHQILSPQQLPRSQASSVTPSNITLDQGSPPSSDDHLSFKFLFPRIFSSCQTLPATLTAADHLTEKGFGRTDSSSSATLTLFWHMSKLSLRGKPVFHIFSPT